MNLLKLLPAALLVAGCAFLPDQEEERPKDIIKDPARIHGFFLKMIREDKPGIAAQVTSIDENVLTLGVHNTIAPDLTRRILLGFEQHSITVSDDKTTATARWCNREFGLSRDFVLRSEYGGKLWKLQITREQIEELATAGLAWSASSAKSPTGGFTRIHRTGSPPMLPPLASAADSPMKGDLGFAIGPRTVNR